MQQKVAAPKLCIKSHEKMRIAGKLVDADAQVEVRNPYSGEVVATVPAASPAQVAEAFRKGNGYKSKLTKYDRQKILMKTAEILSRRRDEIAHVITAESGLCLKDSIYEVGRAYDVYSLAGQLAIRDDSEVYSCDITPHGKPRRIYTSRGPVLGCISAITPFNHPLNMISHKIAPSIAMNNRMVAKPTELTPLTALLLADILYEAGLPPEMLSVVTGNPRTMGDAMITDPHADVVTFTGSVKVGKYIAEKAGYKRLVLELGGNDPLIVMDDLSDTDLDKAAELAVQGATKNSGQRCTAVKRILVVDKVADRFAELVLAKAKKLKCGDPMDPDTDVGTVIHEGAAQAVRGPRQRCRLEGRQEAATAPSARARCSRSLSSITCHTIASWCMRRLSAPWCRSSGCRPTSTRSSASRTRPPLACLRACAPTASTPRRSSSTVSTSAR